MNQKILRRRWLFILIFFTFLFIQQLDIFLGELIREKVVSDYGSSIFNSDNIIFTILLSIILSSLFWGINFDRHSRRNLLVLAGVFWLGTSWLSALAPTLETFILSFGAGLLDFGSMIGIYALLGDFFSPRNRGKVFGLMQAAQPFAYYIVILYFHNLFASVDWRNYLYVSGVLGLTLGLVILLFVREPKRGLSEPALSGIQISGQYFFDWDIAYDIAEKPSFIFLCGLSLFSVLPWSGLTIWISTFLENSQNLIQMSEYALISPILIAVVLGNILGGLLGDFLSRRKKRGRLLANIFVLLLALLTSVAAFLIGESSDLAFRVFVSTTALLVSMLRPNLFALLYKITLPEIRGTATSILFIFQLIGIAIGLALVKVMEVSFGTWMIFFSLTLTSILVNLLLLSGLYKRMPMEVENLRRHMAYRSQLEARLETRK